MIHPELWKKIERIEFDSIAVGKTFSEHLASENGWTLSFAQRAVREYKRFAYLSVISDRDLVPSYAVDQVWRLHLTDTRHYWGTFCKILERQLHHLPLGTHVANREKAVSNYKRTQSLYREEFGKEPRLEFWPAPEDPDLFPQNMERVNRSKYLLLQKPTMSLWRSVARFAGVATFPLSVVVYALNKSSDSITGAITSTGWMMVAGIAVVIAVFGCLVWRMEHQTKAEQKEMMAKDDLNNASPRIAKA